MRLVERCEARLRGAEQVHWAGVLRAEWDNITGAIDWALVNDARLALRLIAGLSTYWWMRGAPEEGAEQARLVLAVAGHQPLDGLAEEYLVAGILAGDVEAIERAQQALLEAGEPFQRPVTVLLWSYAVGSYQEAALVREVLKLNDEGADAWTRAAVQLCYGYPGLAGLTAAEEEQALRTALARFQMLGDRWGSFLALTSLADLLAEPLEPLSQAVEHAEALGMHATTLAPLLCKRANELIRRGELSEARADFCRALERSDDAGLVETAMAARIGLARAARLTGDMKTARRHLVTALAGCPSDLEDARAEVEHHLRRLPQAQTA